MSWVIFIAIAVALLAAMLVIAGMLYIRMVKLDTEKRKIEDDLEFGRNSASLLSTIRSGTSTGVSSRASSLNDSQDELATTRESTRIAFSETTKSSVAIKPKIIKPAAPRRPFDEQDITIDEVAPDSDSDERTTPHEIPLSEPPVIRPMAVKPAWSPQNLNGSQKLNESLGLAMAELKTPQRVPPLEFGKEVLNETVQAAFTELEVAETPSGLKSKGGTSLNELNLAFDSLHGESYSEF